MEDYKEKLRLAKEALDSGSYDKETIEYIFPELKESEDERIRKALIQNLKERFGTKGNMGKGLDMPDVLTWLEKQGEQKYFDWEPSQEEMSALYRSVYIDCYELPDELEKGLRHLYQDLKQKYFNGASIENMFPQKQGEQKPIDKVEQEEDVELTDFESALFSAFSDAWQEYLSGKEINVAKWAKEHSAELLEVAREQKPAWNEEDGIWIDRACMLLNELNDLSHLTLAKIPSNVNEIIRRLKSLKERYTWKPSDEQIKGIKCAIKTLQHQLNVGDKRLNSLYDDLKKLREE